MTTSSEQQADPQAEPQSIPAIEAEIEQTRQDLGATVDELSHRLDVKGRASDKVADVKSNVAEKASDVTHTVQDKAASVGAQVQGTAAGLGERVKPVAQRRDVQAAAGGALLLGLGAAVISKRRK